MTALLVLVIVFPLFVHPRDGSAGLADLPYRLVPGITTSIGVDLRSLSSSESLLVWEDHRGGAPDIYAYDISDDREFRVSRSADFRRSPHVFGTTVLWVSGEDPALSTIRGIDLTEGIEFSVSDEPGLVDGPAVSEDLFAWQERVDGKWLIQVAHRATGNSEIFGESSRNAARPSTSGELVVWQEHDGVSWNIKLFDAGSGEVTAVTSDASDDQYPVISGETVVFLRTLADGGSPQLVVVNLADGSESIVVDDHYVMSPSIYGEIIVWEDWRSGFPDIYAYDLDHDEMYAVARTQQATSPAISDRLIAWISGTDPTSQRVQVLEIQQRLPTDAQEPPAVPSPDRLYIQETQHFVSSGFKAFWQAHGGPQVLGFPLTEEFAEEDPESGDEIIVQYFERVKMEYHPGAPEGERVRLARLGYYLHPQQEAEAVEPFESDDDRRYFETTGQAIGGEFKEFWENNGGLGLFGYPLTGEFIEHGRRVQYFERARFELDPEASSGDQIKLGLLGREALQKRGWLPPPPIDTTQIFE